MTSNILSGIILNVKTHTSAFYAENNFKLTQLISILLNLKARKIGKQFVRSLKATISELGYLH